MLLHSYLANHSQKSPNNTALICGDRRLTYAELEATTNKLAHGFMALGVKRGDRVLICLENSFEAVTSIFAALKAGATFLVASPETGPEELSALVLKVDARLLVTSGSKLISLAPSAMWESAGALRDVVFVGKKMPFSPPANVQFHSFFDQIVENQLFAQCPPIQILDQDLAALFDAECSEHHSRLVMHTHRSLVAGIESLNTDLNFQTDEILLNTLPLSTHWGLTQVLLSFCAGSTLVLDKAHQSLDSLLPLVEREGISCICLNEESMKLWNPDTLQNVPQGRLPFLLLSCDQLPWDALSKFQYQLPELRWGIYHGDPTVQQISCLMMGELTDDIASKFPGRTLTNVEFWLEAGNSESGQEHARELCVRGTQMMAGYWNEAEENRAIFKYGKFPNELSLRTDRFYLEDEHGAWDPACQQAMIATRELPVPLEDIEAVLNAYPAVSEAAVCVLKEGKRNSCLRAVISVMPGYEVTEEELFQFCTDNLEPSHVPQEFFFLANIPRKSDGQFDRAILRQELPLG